MRQFFKASETQADSEIKKIKEHLALAEDKMAFLEEKYVMNEMERDI
jgi:hypothetical protein